MVSCVLLGFTSDGDHLVSYSAGTGENGRGDSNGSYELQVWRFRLGERAKLMATVPIFETDDGGGDGIFGRRGGRGGRGGGERMMDEDFVDGDALGSNACIYVCESWDGSTLCVHGEERNSGAIGERVRGAAKRCFVTVLPNPAKLKPGTAIAATHMSYLSSAQSPFHPSWSGVVPASAPKSDASDGRGATRGEGRDGCDDPYAFEDASPERRKSRKVDVRSVSLKDSGKFVLNTADALLAVDVTTATLNPREPHDRALMEAQSEGRVKSLVDVIPACHSPLVKWHGNDADELTIGDEDVFVDATDIEDAAPYVYVSALPMSVRVCIVTPWITLEMEKVINSSLRAALDFGFSVRDYELLPLQYQVAAKHDEEPSMLVACLSVLEPSSWTCQPSCPGKMRVVVTILDRPLDRTSGVSHVVYSHELPVVAEGRQPTSALVQAARSHIMAVRKSVIIPTGKWTRNASVMSNTNVVASGRSAAALKHPTLPICILGYGTQR